VDIFNFRRHVIADYASYTRSFLAVRDARLKAFVDEQFDGGVLWPEPLVQLNPSFEPGETIDDLIAQGVLLPECRKIFRRKSVSQPQGPVLSLHRHQTEAIRIAKTGLSYVLTTGTGSGKSLSYIVPIVDHVLRAASPRRIKAIIVYPMNALANSQKQELEKYIDLGYPNNKGPVTFARYTGQESEDDRQRIFDNPPDVLLTNYVMLELILTRPRDAALVRAAEGLQFLVFDEMHTYRGRQGADVAMLIRRVREAMQSPQLQCVGTSATLSTSSRLAEQQKDVAAVASKLFGTTVRPEHVIAETLRRVTEPGNADPSALTRRVLAEDANPTAWEQLCHDPLASWLETTFGIRWSDDGRWVRVRPIPVGEAALRLSAETGLDAPVCEGAIVRGLMAGFDVVNPATDRPAFAFRLHQFISRGESVYAPMKSEVERADHFTIHGQQFVPGSDKTEVLMPLVFCRECGQDYYCVRWNEQDKTLRQRDLSDRTDEGGVPGYVYVNTVKPWPSDNEPELLEAIPEDWVEDAPKGAVASNGRTGRNCPSH
jgi:hypothetical protein